MQRSHLEHLTVAAVAVACITLGLAEGGFEPTVFAATALISWIAVLVGLGTGLLPRYEPPRPAVGAALCLAALAGLIAISIAWASNNGLAFEDTVRALAYLGLFVLVVLCSRPGDCGVWVRGLAIGLFGIAAIALLGRFEPSLFGDPDLDLAADVPAAVGRLTYPIGYWNGLAAGMAAALALFVALGTAGRTRIGRALAVGGIPAVVLAIWATTSRGGIAAAAVALIVLVATSPTRTRMVAIGAIGIAAGLGLVTLGLGFDELFDRPGSGEALDQGHWMLLATLAVCAVTGFVRYVIDARLARIVVSRRFAQAAVVATIIAALVGLIALDPGQRIENFKQPPQASDVADSQLDLLRGGGSGRYQFWTSAVDAFEAEPVRGVGAGGYGPYWLENREIAIPASRAHSLLFETLAELGLVGLALVVGLFAIAATVGSKRWLADRESPRIGPALAALSAGIVTSSIDWTWDLPAVFGPTIVAAALLTGPATLRSDRAEGAAGVFGTAHSRRRFAGGVAVLLVAWVAICASGLLLLSDRAIKSSDAALGRGDVEAALSSADNAVTLQPWAAAPRTQQALVYERAGDIPAARDAIAEAVERSPDDFELRLAQARLDLRAGDMEAALTNVRGARALNPRDPFLVRPDEVIFAELTGG